MRAIMNEGIFFTNFPHQGNLVRVIPQLFDQKLSKIQLRRDEVFPDTVEVVWMPQHCTRVDDSTIQSELTIRTNETLLR